MTTKPETTPLDALALQAAALEGAPSADAPQASNPVEDAQAAQTAAMLEAGMHQVVLALLKLGRAFVAKRLPEIREEWTDEALSGPAAAAVPLLRKHLDTLMQIAGSSPEAAALAISCFPLAMGLVTAMERADQREKAEQNRQTKPPELRPVD